MTMATPLLHSTAPRNHTGELGENVVLARWTAVLNDYAANLDEQRSFLLTLHPGAVVEGDALVTVFEAPRDLPPLPVELLPWAQALERETAGLIELASEYLAANRQGASTRGSFSSSTNESIGDWKL